MEVLKETNEEIVFAYSKGYPLFETVFKSIFLTFFIVSFTFSLYITLLHMQHISTEFECKKSIESNLADCEYKKEFFLKNQEIKYFNSISKAIYKEEISSDRKTNYYIIIQSKDGKEFPINRSVVTINFTNDDGYRSSAFVKEFTNFLESKETKFSFQLEEPTYLESSILVLAFFVFINYLRTLIGDFFSYSTYSCSFNKNSNQIIETKFNLFGYKKIIYPLSKISKLMIKEFTIKEGKGSRGIVYGFQISFFDDKELYINISEKNKKVIEGYLIKLKNFLNLV